MRSYPRDANTRLKQTWQFIGVMQIAPFARLWEVSGNAHRRKFFDVTISAVGQRKAE
jgi:hypothetical protein